MERGAATASRFVPCASRRRSVERLDSTGFRWFLPVTGFGATMARFLLAVLIGIGLTLAWQSYGEGAKQIVGPWVSETITSKAPSLAWLLPQGTKPPSRVDEPPKQSPVAAAPKETRTVPFRDITETELAKAAASPSPAPSSPAPSSPAPSAEQGAPSLEAMARDLATIRRSAEQLTAKQQQMAESMEALRAEIEKLASPQPPAAAAPGPARRR
jgi:hypothetical protein